MKNEQITEIKFEKEWIEAIDKAFKKVSKDVEIDGFRKGAVPKNMFIKKYGVESLYEDALHIVLDEQNDKLMGDKKIESVVRPIVDVTAIDENSITISVKKITAPEVKLGEYKNLGIKKTTAKLTKKEIDEEIKTILSESADFVVVDKAIENGDVAVIDFSGVVDGELLEGGTGFDYDLEIGSNSFIPGFEEKLIGLKTGEEKVLNLTFPENYHEHLKGKEVEFTVTIKEVKEKVLAEINADLFADLGLDDVKTEEDFKNHVEKYMSEAKQEETDKKFIDAIFEKGIKKMKVEINPEIIEDEVGNIVMELEDMLTSQGMDMQTYLQMTGGNEEKMRKSLEPDATSRIEVRLFLTQVAKAEGIKADKKEIDSKLEEFCEYSGTDKKEAKENKGLIKHLENIVIMEKTTEFLKSNN